MARLQVCMSGCVCHTSAGLRFNSTGIRQASNAVCYRHCNMPELPACAESWLLGGNCTVVVNATPVAALAGA